MFFNEAIAIHWPLADVWRQYCEPSHNQKSRKKKACKPPVIRRRDDKADVTTQKKRFSLGMTPHNQLFKLIMSYVVEVIL